MSACLFCRIVAGEIPAKIVHCGDDVLAFEDIAPQAPVHLLVIPRRHIASLNDAGPGDAGLLGTLVLTARALAHERGLEAAGYRIVLNTMAGAGQSVFHLHAHLLAGRAFAWPPG